MSVVNQQLSLEQKNVLKQSYLCNYSWMAEKYLPQIIQGIISGLIIAAISLGVPSYRRNNVAFHYFFTGDNSVKNQLARHICVALTEGPICGGKINFDTDLLKDLWNSRYEVGLRNIVSLYKDYESEYCTNSISTLEQKKYLTDLFHRIDKMPVSLEGKIPSGELPMDEHKDLAEMALMAPGDTYKEALTKCKSLLRDQYKPAIEPPNFP